jgi:cytochrome c556
VKLSRIALTIALAAALSPLHASEEPPEFHRKWMKESGDLLGNLRKGVEVEQSATKLEVIYKEVEVFWAKRNSDVALKTCRDAQSASREIATAARASDKTGVSAGMKNLGASCKGCHDAHREKISDTEYRIK